jgi:hypothetical protein
MSKHPQNRFRRLVVVGPAILAARPSESAVRWFYLSVERRQKRRLSPRKPAAASVGITIVKQHPRREAEDSESISAVAGKECGAEPRTLHGYGDHR